MNFKAVLFDLDGVIVSTDRYHFLAWKRLADKNGWFFDEHINHALRGVSRLDSLQIILDVNKIKLSDLQKEAAANEKNSFFISMLNELSDADYIPGSMNFIAKLKKHSMPLAVCSASKNAGMVIDKLGIRSYFDALVYGDQVKVAKPAPDIFLSAASMLKIEPASCLVFEDALSGIEAAKRAGMGYIGIGTADSLPEINPCIKDFASAEKELNSILGF